MVSHEPIHLALSPGQASGLHQGQGGATQGEDSLDHVMDRVFVAASQVQEQSDSLRYTGGHKSPCHVIHVGELSGLGSVGHGEGSPGQRGINGAWDKPWAALAGPIGQERSHHCGAETLALNLLQDLESGLRLGLRVGGHRLRGLVLDKGRRPVPVLVAGACHQEPSARCEAGGRHLPGPAHNRGGKVCICWHSLRLDRGSQVQHEVGGSPGERCRPPTCGTSVLEFHPMRGDPGGHGVVQPGPVDCVILGEKGPADRAAKEAAGSGDKNARNLPGRGFHGG